MIDRLILVVYLFILPNFMSHQKMNDNNQMPTADNAIKKISVRKCCEMNEIYYLKTKNCTASMKEFKPAVHRIINDNPITYELIDNFNVTEKVDFESGLVECPNGTSRLRSMQNKVTLLESGSLIVEANEEPTKTYSSDKYCIENFVKKNDPLNETKFNAFICIEKLNPPNSYHLNSICMLISCFFIVLTVAVYACIPELRNLHGMVLITCLLCFLVGFAFMASLQIMVLNNKHFAEYCLTFTFIIYLSLLSAFFWLNVMCYDIWWTFSGRRSLVRDASGDRIRFVYYCLYAFGIPTCLTILLAVLEFGVVANHKLLPNIRRNGCFLYNYSKLLYFNSPTLVLCVANIIFFALTAKKISDSKDRSERVLSEGPHNRRNKADEHRYFLYIKLFILMGLSWILEMVSYFYSNAFIWKLTDTYNVLSGLFVFIIFVCKAKTLKMIRNRYFSRSPLSKKQTVTTSGSTRTYTDSKNEMTTFTAINTN